MLKLMAIKLLSKDNLSALATTFFIDANISLAAARWSKRLDHYCNLIWRVSYIVLTVRYLQAELTPRAGVYGYCQGRGATLKT